MKFYKRNILSVVIFLTTILTACTSETLVKSKEKAAVLSSVEVPVNIENREKIEVENDTITQKDNMSKICLYTKGGNEITFESKEHIFPKEEILNLEFCN